MIRVRITPNASLTYTGRHRALQRRPQSNTCVFSPAAARTYAFSEGFARASALHLNSEDFPSLAQGYRCPIVSVRPFITSLFLFYLVFMLGRFCHCFVIILLLLSVLLHFYVFSYLLFMQILFTENEYLFSDCFNFDLSRVLMKGFIFGKLGDKQTWK